ncbi:MAG TPA: hypothetical protein VHS31_12775 [Tepidisphaeraceae bacterium]|jgi:hypothetical protein|nr:hypothetical protein [Tepidisphaeraceae bacterium]
MKPVRCPNCQLRWNIRDDMPPFFTCPRCLTALRNPYPSAAFPNAAPPPLPKRVIPVERQTHGDMRIAMIGLVIVVAAVGAGLISLLAAGVNGAGFGIFVVIGLLVSAAACVGVAMYVRKSRPSIAPTPAVVPTRGPVHAGLTPLEYERPQRDETKLSGGAFFGQAIGGIIAGIVITPVLAGLFGAVSNYNAAIIGILIAPAAGIALCFVPRVRGFGVGLIIALPVAFLLLLGFCAIILSGANWHGS